MEDFSKIALTRTPDLIQQGGHLWGIVCRGGSTAVHPNVNASG